MANTIDVHDLAEDKVKIVEELVDKLCQKNNGNNNDDQSSVDLEPLNTRPLGVKGKLTRKEIYDHI